ncbi:monosaccharide ABC transporter substrate-binding protein, CUT2 family [Amycolatopsis marina]|uniref:Monosaccharide ABC transporter substrate-binding protein, CUT2 family n=1 Tax=Amycolatopsis marina TaxID=490629 RepID=A0A1I1BW16_9PSEU|nr:substrate-binding domain-containing protein [Amycolatopsis marina]SFB52523.1 monosaccharide ABC transporter substrate-binding protein, CUT2 family [Amycolatopsis marina]
MTARMPGRRGYRVTVVAACVLLTLPACSASGGSPAPAVRNGGVAQPCAGASGDYTIGVSQGNVADAYGAQTDADIRKAAAATPQFTLRFADAQGDNGTQAQQLEQFLDEGVDLIVITPNEGEPLSPAVKRVFDQGTPVLVLDRRVEGGDYTSFIGADNVEVGRQAGRFVAGSLLPGGGQTAEIRGLVDSDLAEERSVGFAEVIAERENVRSVGAVDGDWLRDKARQQANVLLKEHPDIDVLYAHNDAMAEGAYLAARDTGREDVDVVGVGGLPTESGGLKAVESGRLAATFAYPTGGKEAVATARRILIGCEPAPKNQTLSAELVTRENARRVYSRLTQ